MDLVLKLWWKLGEAMAKVGRLYHLALVFLTYTGVGITTIYISQHWIPWYYPQVRLAVVMLTLIPTFIIFFSTLRFHPTAPAINLRIDGVQKVSIHLTTLPKGNWIALVIGWIFSSMALLPFRILGLTPWSRSYSVRFFRQSLLECGKHIQRYDVRYCKFESPLLHSADPRKNYRSYLAELILEDFKSQSFVERIEYGSPRPFDKNLSYRFFYPRIYKQIVHRKGKVMSNGFTIIFKKHT
ncbi:hypothetical protein [Herbaspirillum sp. meg3]|uniref:hypothetical protein n=1 Tax=Herbaspirillum sp. meg3 TaxID=2025949 RepID=UPI0012FDE749|nr:hypothetical protein [Herbaspirillum sp. meg3]